MRWLITVSALLAACGAPPSAPVGPPRGAAPPAAPMPAEPSALSVPLTIPLADLAASIDRELPKILVQERGKPLQGPLRLDLDVTRTGGPSLSPKGAGAVRATVPLRVEAKVFADGLPRGKGAGGLPVTASLDVLLDLTPSIAPDGGLRAATALDYRWTDPPRLQVGPASLPLEQVVDPKLRAELPAIADRIAREIEAKDKTREAVRQAWDRLAGVHPTPSDRPGWVRIVPTALAVAPIRVGPDALRTTVSVAATVDLGLGAPPAAAPTPMPELRVGRDAPASLRVPVEVALPWDALSREATAALARAPATSGVEIRSVELYPSGDRVAAGLDVTAGTPAGPVEGRVWLLGRPEVDPATRSVVLRDADYATEIGAADALFNHADVRAAALARVRDDLRLDWGPALDAARDEANARLGAVPAPPGLTVHAALRELALTGIVVTDAALVVRARADGTLDLVVRPPARPPRP